MQISGELMFVLCGLIGGVPPILLCKDDAEKLIGGLVGAMLGFMGLSVLVDFIVKTLFPSVVFTWGLC